MTDGLLSCSFFNFKVMHAIPGSSSASNLLLLAVS